jgi:drug/metabolite transporter (DMT)-like permease
MTDQSRAYLFAGLSVLLWSTVATAFKLALRELSFIELLFYSSVFSTLALFIYLLASGHLRLVKETTLQDLAKSAFLGLINPFIYYLVLFKAYSLLPAQIAQPLNYTWAILLSVLSVPLLKQKLRLVNFLGLVVSFAGVVVIATRGSFASLEKANLTGCLLAVGSALFWALFWIFNLRDRRQPAVKLFLNFAFGTIYIGVLLALCGEWHLPSPFTLGVTIYIGLFEMGLTFLFWLLAMQYSRESASIANLIYLSPFLSLIFIHFLLGEDILWSSVVGLALIVAGILLPKIILEKPK